jgi:hypothetical protein
VRNITKPSSVLFRSDEEFEAYNQAVQFLYRAGFSCGSMERGSPTGFVHGDCTIMKWRDLSDEDKAEMHGEITARGSSRHGPIWVDLYDTAPQEARDAFVAAAERHGQARGED